MNLKVSTILLNWDGYNDTFECLNSLQKVKNKNFEIINFVIKCVYIDLYKL